MCYILFDASCSTQQNQDKLNISIILGITVTNKVRFLFLKLSVWAKSEKIESHFYRVCCKLG